MKRNLTEVFKQATVQVRGQSSGVTRALIGGGGGGCIFIYSCSARRISFEMNIISKEIRRAEHEYMNIHPPINALVTPLGQSQVLGNGCMLFVLFHLQNVSRT